MKQTKIYLLLLIGITLFAGGCLSKVDRVTTNYYILDYKKSTEQPVFRISEPFPMSCEVFDTEVNRTYNRSQMVIKESFSKVSYLSGDLWANRLSDAVPNLIVQRFKAYNIFRQVARSTGDIAPDYYLETNLNSIEKVKASDSKAAINLEFKLRDAKTQRSVVSYLYDKAEPLHASDVAYLVEVYNDMIMEATDIFAGKCRLFLEGKPSALDYTQPVASEVERYVGELEDILNAQTHDGELLLLTSFDTESEMHYTYYASDKPEIIKREGVFGVTETLSPGKYKLLLGENQEFPVNVEVKPKKRTVVNQEWAELIVHVQDQSQTKVRLGYNLWKKVLGEYDYYFYGSDTSLGEDDFGQKDKIWILTPGTYMVKLGSGHWNELKDFTTVTVEKGDNKLLTVVVDPTGEGNYMLGAGLLGNKESVLGRSKIHKGTLSLDLNINSSNEISDDEPSYDASLVGRTDNTFDVQRGSQRFTARSLYSLGLKYDNQYDLRINPDTYSLKNVFLYTPLRKRRYFKNFSFYGRGDVNTHFFDEYIHFSEPRNLIYVCGKGDTLWLATGQDKARTKIALFPLRLKEGIGITYRWVPSPKFNASIRGGYGWQQDFDKHSYTLLHSNVHSQVPGDTLRYDIYNGSCDNYSSGIESTLVLSAINILKFLTINSSVDVLFPMDKDDYSPRFESETRFNIKLYRNISMDFSVLLEYDKARHDWLVYKYNTYLRLSIFY